MAYLPKNNRPCLLFTFIVEVSSKEPVVLHHDHGTQNENSISCCLLLCTLNLNVFLCGFFGGTGKLYAIFAFSVHYNGELCICLDKLELSFFFFPFIDKLYHPVCSAVPASFQAQGRRPRDFNKG